MRGIHLGVELDFETSEERDDSEQILMWLLGILCKRDLQYLRQNPDTPLLYDSGVIYTQPDQSDGRPPLTKDGLRRLLALLRELGCDPETALMIVRMVKGIEIFLDTPALYRRGRGDCNELVPQRVAENWRAGVAASPHLIPAPNDRGGLTYHVVVKYPDGSSEDPSLILGMGTAAERREEIRKNAERWDNYMRAAKRLVAVEGVSPIAVGRRIDAMGLIPRDGVFRSPWRLAA